MNEQHDGQGQQHPPHKASRARDKVRYANVYGLVLTQAEVGTLLIMSASDYASEMCSDRNCEVCDGFVQMWHGIYGMLSAAHRLGVEEALSLLDTPTPRVRDGGL